MEFTKDEVFQKAFQTGSYLLFSEPHFQVQFLPPSCLYFSSTPLPPPHLLWLRKLLGLHRPAQPLLENLNWWRCIAQCLWLYVTKFSTISLNLTKLYVTYIELCNSVFSHIQRNMPKLCNSAHMRPPLVGCLSTSSLKCLFCFLCSLPLLSTSTVYSEHCHSVFDLIWCTALRNP